MNSSIIRSLLVDKQNLLRVGSENGLNLYNKNLDRFENIELISNGKTKKFPVFAITEYNNKTLLVGTDGGRLYDFKKNLNYQLIPYGQEECVSNLLINSNVKSPNGKFLIGTNHGLMTFGRYSEILQLAEFKTNDGYAIININM